MIAVSHSVLKGETIGLDSWIGFASVAAANESGNNFCRFGRSEESTLRVLPGDV